MTAIEFGLRIIDALERCGIPYMVVGSFSSNVYGIPRSTKDIDFVVQLGDVSITRLAEQVGSEFILDPQLAFETVTGTMRYRMKHRATAFMVELFLLSDDPYDQSRFSRRGTASIGGREAIVPAVEDVIITKLRWSRQGRRDKDVADVRDVLSVQSESMDLAYIRGWCDQHGTRELFERLLDDAADDAQG